MANLKPREVTDLLRKCSVSHVCDGCPLEGMSKCDEELMKQAAEVIEELSAKVPRWISVDERRPDKELAKAQLDIPGIPGIPVIARIEGSRIAMPLYWDGDVFFDVIGSLFRVVAWMPMPDI